MIRYTLQCPSVHGFEAWFRSSADFDRQKKRGLLTCPQCGATSIEKQIMAPRIANPQGSDGAVRQDGEPVALMAQDEGEVQRRLMLRKLRDHVIANSEDVGERFAEEARRIHYEESEHRAIRGQATPDEAKALIDDGIAVAPLPLLPENLS